MSYTIETTRSIFDDSEGAAIHVGADTDGLGLVRIYVDLKDEKYWGKLDLTISPDMSRLLAKAINLRAEEAENERP